MACTPVASVIPWAILETIAATGSPGISRGRVKFKMKANINVTKNHTALPPKYLKYAFKPTPPFLSLQLFYYEDKTRVVEMLQHFHHPVGRALYEQPDPGCLDQVTLWFYDYGLTSSRL
jgi:hypothetical protein